MGQGYQPNGPMKSGQMGMQVKANDMTGVPIELQTWSGMQARMDPDRARIQQRRIERTKNTENYIRARQENLAALRQMRIELAARATKAGSQVVSECCTVEPLYVLRKHAFMHPSIQPMCFCKAPCVGSAQPVVSRIENVYAGQATRL